MADVVKAIENERAWRIAAPSMEGEGAPMRNHDANESRGEGQ
jgi:hypothetical protein